MHPANILLMEDDGIIAADIQTTLRQAGYGVITGYPEIFNAGDEFPDNIDRMIVDAHINLVLMDINLNSQLDGVDIVKHIHLKTDIPVIYISGISKPETVRRAKESEPYAYLLKPFSPAQLRSQVEMTLQLYQSSRKKKAELEEKTGVWHLTVSKTGIQTTFAWLSLFGFGEDKIRSEEDFLQIIHPEDVDGMRHSVGFLKRKLISKRSFEYRILDGNGETRWVLSKIVDARTKPTGEFCYTILSLEITQQKKREEGLLYDSSHDNLTGLLNRKAFMEELDKLIRDTGLLQKNFALIFSDLDNFKQVNDDYGHETGDRLLKSVATRFRQAIKKKDLLARFGGDEFAFIIRDLKKSADIHYVAQCILNSLHAPLFIDGHKLTIGISLGVAMPEAVSGTAESLLKNADKAMYHAKKDQYSRYKLFRPNIEQLPMTWHEQRLGGKFNVH
jgi:diguanylate cyclase (GGDEF)-like protein